MECLPRRGWAVCGGGDTRLALPQLCLKLTHPPHLLCSQLVVQQGHLGLATRVEGRGNRTRREKGGVKGVASRVGGNGGHPNASAHCSHVACHLCLVYWICLVGERGIAWWEESRMIGDGLRRHGEGRSVRLEACGGARLRKGGGREGGGEGGREGHASAIGGGNWGERRSCGRAVEALQ